jgi:RNA polymerase sigma-70 factor (ECF subfamily)
VTGGSFSAAVELTSNTGSDDRELVAAAQNRTAEFAAIYQKYADRIYLYIRSRYIRSRVSTDDDSLDITQQVFLKAMRSLPNYTASDIPLAAWLFRIARNAVIDHHRRHRSEARMDAMPPILFDHDPGPEETALRSENAARLRAALLHLDADKRELLSLRYAGGLRIREIAQATGKSEEAVKKRLSRALKTLKDKYDETP